MNQGEPCTEWVTTGLSLIRGMEFKDWGELLSAPCQGWGKRNSGKGREEQIPQRKPECLSPGRELEGTLDQLLDTGVMKCERDESVDSSSLPWPNKLWSRSLKIQEM